ncbi:hypothetical protein SLS62_010619 [Diatrype stigma]|uniref:BZIP domain-containing protein n=1 Tax=Diatrype stigma TaxID=117547 RepID=A0AAN9UB27_9PEZI
MGLHGLFSFGDTFSDALSLNSSSPENVNITPPSYNNAFNPSPPFSIILPNELDMLSDSDMQPLSEIEPLEHSVVDVPAPPPQDQPPPALETTTTTTTMSRGTKRSLTPTTVDPVTANKRQRNNEAARKYRQKRIDRITELEGELSDIKQERDDLRIRLARQEAEAAALRSMLQLKSTSTSTSPAVDAAPGSGSGRDSTG